MSTPYYDIYISQVMALAQTLVVQSSATADAMNNGLASGVTIGSVTIPATAVDLSDNTTWKYYMNLQGLYHPTDLPMSVTSIDTLQTIAFTVDNLKTNLATARAYAFGTPQYNELVAQFPTQEMLIRCIVNPVTFEKDQYGQLIIPDDGTILWYDSSLVEPNETNLIPNLQKWLYTLFSRWDNSAYTLVDDLYAASFLGVLFSMLPVEILNIRTANCKTRFAHSFHVREYLASNGGLDIYVDTLTTEQKLWLYRNIQYIKRNAGKQSTFKWLVDNLMTASGLPLAEWNMKQDTSNMPGALTPTPEFVRNPLNFGYSITGQDTLTVEELFNLEVPLAKDNLTVETDHVADATTRMSNSKFNALKTKVLESSIIDLTDASLYTLSDCLLNQWMYWAYSGRYRAVLSLNDPHTGAPFNAPVKDAFLLYLYAYNLSVGQHLVEIPDVVATHIQRIPPPTYAMLRAMSDPQYITQQDIMNALGVLPSTGICISTDAFYNACLDIQAGIMAGRELYCAKEDLNQRAQMEIVTQFCYCDVLLPYSGGNQTTYASWLDAQGYQFGTYSAEEWGVLAAQILTEATGTDLLNIRNLKDMQAAMLSLMSRLSSYSVQYIQSINDSVIKVIDWSAFRIGTWQDKMNDLLQLDVEDVHVLDLKAKFAEYIVDDLDSGHMGVDLSDTITLHDTIEMPLLAEFEQDMQMRLNDRYNIALIYLLDKDEPTQDLGGMTLNLVSPDYTPLSLLELSEGFDMTSLSQYTELTSQDRSILRARFLGVLGTPISTVLHQYILDGLTYPQKPTTTFTDPLI